jgi:hypothetical protein
MRALHTRHDSFMDVNALLLRYTLTYRMSQAKKEDRTNTAERMEGNRQTSSVDSFVLRQRKARTSGPPSEWERPGQMVQRQEEQVSTLGERMLCYWNINV